MAKAKDLGSLKQTHGALNAPISIDRLTGQIEGYSVETLAEYRELLASMTDVDLHQHAVDVAGVTPIHNRILLLERLESKFITSQSRGVAATPVKKMSKADQDFQRKFFGTQS